MEWKDMFIIKFKIVCKLFKKIDINFDIVFLFLMIKI